MKPKVNDQGHTVVETTQTDRQRLAAAAGVLKELANYAHGSKRESELRVLASDVAKLVPAETFTFAPLTQPLATIAAAAGGGEQ